MSRPGDGALRVRNSGHISDEHRTNVYSRRVNRRKLTAPPSLRPIRPDRTRAYAEFPAWLAASLFSIRDRRGGDGRFLCLPGISQVGVPQAFSALSRVPTFKANR